MSVKKVNKDALDDQARCQSAAVFQAVISKKEHAELIREAAELVGASVSGFMRASAVKEARRVIKQSKNF